MNFAQSISARNRQRKWGLFLRTIAPTSSTTVLDVGFNDREHSAVDNYLEKHYPWPGQITALGVQEPREFPKRYPEVKVVQYAGGRFPFPDQSFDVVWSNAVIEHVGDRTRQLEFVREIARVGRRAFITTPNRHFPVEVHTLTPFLHWLPDPVFHAYLRLIGKGWAAGDYMRLLSGGDLRGLLSEAGWNYQLRRNRLCGLTLDFVALLK